MSPRDVARLIVTILASALVLSYGAALVGDCAADAVEVAAIRSLARGSR